MKLAITSNGVQTVFPLPKTFTVDGTSVEVNGSPAGFTWTGTNEITLDDVPTEGDRVVFEHVDEDNSPATYQDILDALTAFAASPGFGADVETGEVKMFVGDVPTGYTRISGSAAPNVINQRFAGVCVGGNTNANLNRGLGFVSASGKVLFAQDRWVEEYTRTTETWAVKYTRTGFDRCGMGPLANGKLLMVGGNTTVSNACIVYDPVADTATAAANYPVAIRNSFGALMPNGKTMMAGGTVTGGSTTAAVYEYDFVADTFTALANLPGGASNNPILVGIDEGVFHVVGAAAYVYDRGTDTWVSKAAPPVTMGLDFVAGRMPNNKVIAFQANGSVPSSFYIYDPATNSWETIGRRLRFVENKVRPAVVSTSQNVYIAGYGSTTSETHIANWSLEFPEFWATQPYYAKKD